MNVWPIQDATQLRQRKELEAVFDSITDILVVVSPDLAIRDLNKAALRSIGFSDREEVLGKLYCETACNRHNCRWAQTEQLRCVQCRRNENCSDCHLREVFETGKSVSRELELADKCYITSVYPVFDERRTIVRAVSLLRDITAIKQKSGQLVQSQKMQAVGHLAAGLAHELRNPLGAIANHLYILEESIRQDKEKMNTDALEASTVAIDSIRRLVERSDNIIRTLLDFSREKAAGNIVFNVRDLVGQVEVLVGKTAQQKGVLIEVAGDAGLVVESDAGAFQHILFNLIINSIDAMKTCGTVKMHYWVENDRLIFRIADTGEGICRDDLDKIYNPFYTTKSPSQGTGLGLFVVYNLVSRMEGQISVESEPGLGTAFTVRLPRRNKTVVSP